MRNACNTEKHSKITEVILAGKPQEGWYPVGSTFHIGFQLPKWFKNISLTGGSKGLRENKN